MLLLAIATITAYRIISNGVTPKKKKKAACYYTGWSTGRN